jgi:hypothetical protein
VIEAWPNLPDPIRRAVLALVAAAAQGQSETHTTRDDGTNQSLKDPARE